MPSIREIQVLMNKNSSSTVARLLRILEEREYIERQRAPRSIKIIKELN